MEHKDYDWPWGEMDTVPIDNELNTLLRLNPEFPFAVSFDNLSSYKNRLVNWHKQGSIEMSVVTEGIVTVNLLNHQEQIKAGEGFVIFPGVLHSISGNEMQCPAKYQTMFFDPCLLTGFRGSYFEKHYYKPEIINRNGFFHLSIADGLLRSWENELRDIFLDNYWGDAYLQCQIQQKLQRMWIDLWDNLIAVQNKGFYRTDDSRLFKIIDFIQKNYQKKFVLDELCVCVNLSRSACCRYFKKMMHMSVSDYLNEYRLSQALFLLHNTDQSITEIAVQSGFSTTSYFISRFKEKMMATPLEYKMKNKCK